MKITSIKKRSQVERNISGEVVFIDLFLIVYCNGVLGCSVLLFVGERAHIHPSAAPLWLKQQWVLRHWPFKGSTIEWEKQIPDKTVSSAAPPWLKQQWELRHWPVRSSIAHSHRFLIKVSCCCCWLRPVIRRTWEVSTQLLFFSERWGDVVGIRCYSTGCWAEASGSSNSYTEALALISMYCEAWSSSVRCLVWVSIAGREQHRPTSTGTAWCSLSQSKSSVISGRPTNIGVDSAPCSRSRIEV